MKLPDHIKAMLTDSERAAVAAFEDGATHAVEVQCPRCACAITVALGVKTRGVVESSDFVVPSQRPSQVDQLPVGADAKLLQEASRMGVLSAFTRAVNEIPAAGRPSNPSTFFVDWMKRVQKMFVSAPMLESIRTGYRTAGYVELWQANGIVAVLDDKTLVAFVPTCLLKRLHVGPMQTSMSSTVALERWVKGRFGYVPAGATLFSEAMSQRAHGSFDTVRG